jgi:hypothetical protein
LGSVVPIFQVTALQWAYLITRISLCIQTMAPFQNVFDYTSVVTCNHAELELKLVILLVLFITSYPIGIKTCLFVIFI